LINLIPEEIKHQIVQKLNEEENKNDWKDEGICCWLINFFYK
jgi:hypothetical protein